MDRMTGNNSRVGGKYREGVLIVFAFFGIIFMGLILIDIFTEENKMNSDRMPSPEMFERGMIDKRGFENNNGIISVQGNGKASSEPNTVLISLEIIVEGDDLDDVSSESSKIYRSLTSSLKRIGIEEENIETNYYNVNPMYAYPENESPRIDGYRVVHAINVKSTVKNYDELGKESGKIVDTAIRAGVISVGNIQFILDEESEEKLQEEALRDAIQNAKRKGEYMANELDIRLGEVKSVSEGAYTTNPDMMSLRFAAEADFAPSFSPKDYEVTASVSVIFMTK
jgi:uncharacterized protein YggE|tara:strand:+ start:963 stop:1811 length:849 start_codon:yes stop_codon:yes gene_type:complete